MQTAMDDDLMDDTDEPAFTPVKDAFRPAYALSADSAGPQCSASTDFCLFCEFANDGIVSEMKTLVHTLAADGKELPVITEALRRAYEDGVREETEWSPPGCPPVHAPEWTTASIRRHLLYSTEFSELFDVAIVQMFHSIIERQNASMIDSSTNMVVEEHRAAFTDTVKTFIKFKAHQDAIAKRRGGSKRG